MAIVAYDDGGFVGSGGSNTMVTGSITGGNTVVIFFKSRDTSAPQFTHASGLSGLTLIAGPNDTGFGDDGTSNLYKATKNGTGALTLTPDPVGQWWRAIVWDCETMVVVDQGMIDEGLFDDTISYTSPTMPSGGGTGLGMSVSGRGDNIVLTAPTWTGVDVEEAHDGGNFRVSISYGEITIAASATATMTGTLSATGSHFESWVLLQAAAGPTFDPPAPLWHYRSTILRR